MGVGQQRQVVVDFWFLHRERNGQIAAKNNRRSRSWPARLHKRYESLEKMAHCRITQIEDYEAFIRRETVERIRDDQCKKLIKMCEPVDLATQDLILEITAEEQAHRRQFIGFLYEYERGEAKRLTAAAA
jgi:hypothetical protein